MVKAWRSSSIVLAKLQEGCDGWLKCLLCPIVRRYRRLLDQQHRPMGCSSSRPAAPARPFSRSLAPSGSMRSKIAARRVSSCDDMRFFANTSATSCRRSIERSCNTLSPVASISCSAIRVDQQTQLFLMDHRHFSISSGSRRATKRSAAASAPVKQHRDVMAENHLWLAGPDPTVASRSRTRI
jgi:hypothetical protein